MELSQLTEAEGLALIGLLKLIVRADKVYSDEEAAAIEAIAAQMGGDWQHALEHAQVLIKTSADALAVADQVQRPAARALVYKQLYELAASDEIVPEEARILGWLAEEWDIEGIRAAAEE